MTSKRKPYQDDIRLTEKGKAVARYAAQERVDKFNAAHPIGTKVRYHPVIGQPEFTEHVTRSEAMVIENGLAVVWLKDKAGCVALEAVEVVKEEL